MAAEGYTTARWAAYSPDFVAGQTYTYQFISGTAAWPSPLPALIDAEMKILNGSSPAFEAGTWANVPKFVPYVPGVNAAPRLQFQYGGSATPCTDVKTSCAVGYTYHNPMTSGGASARIQFTLDNVGGFYWCGINSRTTGCWPIANVLAHELGHAYGLYHTALVYGPAATQTIMGRAVYPVTTTANRYGKCDMAGLQAKWGPGAPSSKLSTCLPSTTVKLNLTGPTSARAGTSVTLTATFGSLSPSTVSTVYYNDSSTPGTASVSVARMTWNRDVRLHGTSQYGTVYALGSSVFSSGVYYLTIPTFDPTWSYYATYTASGGGLPSVQSNTITIAGA
jgi:hypothetical protein